MKPHHFTDTVHAITFRYADSSINPHTNHGNNVLYLKSIEYIAPHPVVMSVVVLVLPSLHLHC